MSTQKRDKGLGERSRDELALSFANMYSGWDRGVNVTQERFGNGETRFTESPMNSLELAARYVAAEIGLNIFEIANRAAFAPIITYQNIQIHIGPVFATLTAERDALVKALQFYASEWQPNGEGDPETPGLSRSWVEPTDELQNDGGRKANEALAKVAACPKK